LLRRRRRPDVDGGADRQADQHQRIEEALALSPDTISTACPYCLVMLGDAVSAKKSSGEARETLEVVDVAQLLARSVTPAATAAASPTGATGSSGGEDVSLAGEDGRGAADG